jgi:phage gp29-like protein
MLHVFHTAPSPVLTPQPNRHILSSGESGETFAQEISETTVYSKVFI